MSGKGFSEWKKDLMAESLVNNYLDDIFDAQQVSKLGGVVRREIEDVKKNCGSIQPFIDKAIHLKASHIFKTKLEIVAIFNGELDLVWIHR